MDTFVFLKVLAVLAVPPASMVLGLVVGGVLAILGWRRLGGVAATLAIAQTVVMSCSPVADALILSLEEEARIAAAQAPACCYEAIIVLGGGMTAAAPPLLMEPDLSDAADRVWYAARLYHRGVAPRIIVSGGRLLAKTVAATTEAEAMRRFLVDLGVPSEAIVSEGEAMNTIENIRNVRRIVGEGRVALVTSAYHMPRALLIARRSKLNVGAFPTDWYGPPDLRLPWEIVWIPSIGAMAWSSIGLKEHVAILLDRRGDF
jgi:uncharacterized SAM-binding protein YcdF (DUF218 family)